MEENAQTKEEEDLIQKFYSRFQSQKAFLREMREKLKESNLSLQGIAPLLEPEAYQKLFLKYQNMKLSYENLEYQVDESEDLHLDDRRHWPTGDK